MTAFTAATLPGVVAPAGADFDAVLCDSARLGPARTKTNADSVAKAGIHLTKHRAPRGPGTALRADRLPAGTMILLLSLSLISLLLPGLFRFRSRVSTESGVRSSALNTAVFQDYGPWKYAPGNVVSNPSKRVAI